MNKAAKDDSIFFKNAIKYYSLNRFALKTTQ